MVHRLFAVLPLVAAFAASDVAAMTCVPSTVPQVVHAEGISERVGNIVFTCSGGVPNDTINVNLFFYLNVNITNRLTSVNSGTLTGITLTADNGSGPEPIAAPPSLAGPGTLVFNGANFTLSSSGTVTLQLTGLRGAADQLDFDTTKSMQVTLGVSGSTPFPLTSNLIMVGQPQRGLYVGSSGALVCTQGGSPAPLDLSSFAAFLGSHSAFTSTRLTEGFAASFAPKADPQNLNADTGTRFLIQYSGFPSGARIFVPTIIAGSDATQPTAAGDLGQAASGGKYTPGSTPSLLLSVVSNASASGSGGVPLYLPLLPGSGTASFDAMTEVPLTNGIGSITYEVMDANPFVQESAQFPTFLTVPPSGSGLSITTTENATLGPISTVETATALDPIPRFERQTPPPDCSIEGDCGAHYFPVLRVVETSLSYAAQAGGGGQTNYVHVQNTSGGILSWTASVAYTNGSGWLTLFPTQGQNSATIRIDANPGTMAPGTYQAVLTVDAGPLAGTKTVPITFVITSTTVQPPVIQSAVNAASFASVPLVPGSFATLMGSKFSGQNVTVAFDSTPAQLVFNNATQINLLVPASLAGKTSSHIVVTVDGIASAPFAVTLAPFAPGIFQPGVLNQDNTVNSATKPAAAGSVIQVFATGLSGNGVITAKIDSQVVTQPYYGGPAPGIPGLQQVDLILPAVLTSNTVNVSVCGGATVDQQTCSPTVPVAVMP